MTVCVAQLANHGAAIVLVADKALTYGGFYRPPLQAESGGIEKRIAFGDFWWNALLSGDSTAAELVIRQAVVRLEKEPALAESVGTMMDTVKDAYKHVREQAISEQVLQPRLLTKELFIARSNSLLPLSDRYFMEVAERIEKFGLNCQLLVCGFDNQREGHIFSVHDPGVVSSHEIEGYGAIGIGAEMAISRLAWNEAESDDSLDFALYQALEAKGFAESIQGVGGASDIWTMVLGQTIEVPSEIQQMVVSVIRRATRLPFRRRKGWDVRNDWPKNWEKRLKDFTDKVAESASEKESSTVESAGTPEDKP